MTLSPETTSVDLCPQSADAFGELLDALRRCTELTTSTSPDENDAADGYRWAMHMLISALGQFYENDPERPRFVPLIMPTMAQPWAAHATPVEIWGPNPHTIYDWAPLAAGRSYRIRGIRGAVRYVGFALYSGTEWNGLMPARIGDSLNMTDLVCAEDGSFEIVIGQTRPAGAPNFLEVDADVHSVLVRQFFADPAEEPARYLIEPLDAVGPAPRPTDATTAHRLRSVTAFLRETGINFLEGFGQPMPIHPMEVNTFDLAGLDERRTAAGRALRGGPGFMYINPDHWYLYCRYELGENEALVIDLTPPDCHWWGLYAMNRYMQTFDYLRANNLVSGENAVPEADGTVRVVVSPRDPEQPNWIDTGGRSTGTLIIRWTNTGIDPSALVDVPIPTTRVVTLDQLPQGVR